jgi:hypothetical protein
VQLSWQPLLLLSGKIAIKQFVLKDVHIRDNRPESKAPPDLGWPKVTGVPDWLNIRIGKLQIDGLEYRRMNEAPTVVTRISSRVIWQGNLLAFWNLSVATQSMHVEGAMMAGFHRPSLFLNLTYVPAHPIAGLDKLFFKAKLHQAHRPEQVAGKVQLTGMSVKRELLKMTGELGITRNSVTMKNLNLHQPGRRGNVSGAGELVFASRGPMLQARLNLADLDLSQDFQRQQPFPEFCPLREILKITGEFCHLQQGEPVGTPVAFQAPCRVTAKGSV